MERQLLQEAEELHLFALDLAIQRWLDCHHDYDDHHHQIYPHYGHYYDHRCHHNPASVRATCRQQSITETLAGSIRQCKGDFIINFIIVVIVVVVVIIFVVIITLIIILVIVVLIIMIADTKKQRRCTSRRSRSKSPCWALKTMR